MGWNARPGRIRSLGEPKSRLERQFRRRTVIRHTSGCNCRLWDPDRFDAVSVVLVESHALSGLTDLLIGGPCLVTGGWLASNYKGSFKRFYDRSASRYRLPRLYKALSPYRLHRVVTSALLLSLGLILFVFAALTLL